MKSNRIIILGSAMAGIAFGFTVIYFLINKNLILESKSYHQYTFYSGILLFIAMVIFTFSKVKKLKKENV